jgi:hypothetical protein
MKNYIIGALLVIILILSSIIYKNEVSPRCKFPVPEQSHRTDVKVPLFLYVFFSKNNCTDCLEIIEVLNRLPSHFIVTGFVPRSQLANEKEVRGITGAAFPLRSAVNYKKYIPWYTPTIIGVSPVGDILFELPGVPGEKEYLVRFLNSLYEKVYPILLEKKMSPKNKN